MSVLKYIFNTVFRVNKLREDDLKSIHIRDVMPILYLIYVGGFLILLFEEEAIRESAFPIPIAMMSCVIALFGLIFSCIINGAILYTVSKYLKKPLKFRVCCKVVLVSLIVNAVATLILPVVQAVTEFVGGSLGEIIKWSFNWGTTVYGWGIALYFLKKFFGYEKKDLSVYGAVILILWLIPTVGKYILSLIV